jgi:tripartite-type tricarboxylate transporter receptor subunit TctC
MIPSIRSSGLLGCCMLAAAALPAAGAAPEFPVRPIRMVVPFPPAGSTDVVARTLGIHLGLQLGQSVIIDNRPGASGNIGAGIVAQAAPDGYTILMGTISTTILNPLMYPKASSDPNVNLGVPRVIATSPFALVAPAASPTRSVRELIAAARARPGEINFASASSGTTGHLALELLKLSTDIDVTHVPFKGGGPAMTALVGGQVQFLFDSITTSATQFNAGRIRAIAVTGARRTPLMPEVPTMIEAGVPGFETTGWWALILPKQIPDPIARRYDAALAQALRTQDFQQRLAQLGAEPFAGTPEENLRFVRAERARWSKVIKAANLRLEY